MGNDLRVLDPPVIRRFGELSASFPVASSSSRANIVRGRAATMAMRPMLAELGRRTGQAGALDSLELLLNVPTALRKTPYLVLVGLRAGIAPSNITADDLQGVVLLYEYRVAGFATKVFSTDDYLGQRTVIAPPGIRAQVAEAACQILADQGALISLITLEKTQEGDAAPNPKNLPDKSARFHLAMRTRIQARDLLLAETFEATLATLGKHTRRNLRYYRRRAEADLQAAFVPAAKVTRDQLFDLNRSSTNPVSEAEAAWRYAYLGASPDRMFAGVMDGQGRWLSVIAGSRRGNVTQIDWQVNRADLPRYSLSTVMRSYLLEHEIKHGMKKMVFMGGTPHSMGQSFEPSETVDVIAVRRSMRAWILRRFSRWFFPHSNFLGNALIDPNLTWIS